MSVEDDMLQLQEQIKALRAELKEKNNVLSYYADPLTYKSGYFGMRVEEDVGNRAFQVLNKYRWANAPSNRNPFITSPNSHQD